MSSLLNDFIKTNNPLIWVYSEEEVRFIEEESSHLIASKACKQVYIYDARGSIYDVRGVFSDSVAQSREYDSQIDAINDFSEVSTFDWDDLNNGGESTWDIKNHGYPNESILIMLDIPFYMVDAAKVQHTNAMLTRTIKCAAMKNIQQRKSIVIVNHHKTVPIELDGIVTYVEHPHPTITKLKKVVIGAKDMLRSDTIPSIELDDEETTKVAQQLKGLTMWQSEHVLAQANRQNAIDYHSGLTKIRGYKTEVIQKEKARLISKSSTIEIIQPKYDLTAVGGMENFKEWIKDTESSFRSEAREDGIDLPKGVLVVGAGGTGKSYLAQGLAKEWNRPLLKLDISSCMGSLLGESEGKLIKALKDAEAQAPCILFLDEFEKLFSGASGQNLDGGTFQRMYGTWLFWTQSRKEDVFIVATTNGVERLPAPALRKGRFDEIFFVDLPSKRERKIIFDIHLTKRGWGFEDFPLIDTVLLADKTPNRTGSEIEQIVVQGLLNKVKRKGFGKQNPLETSDLLDAVTSVRTMYQLNPGESDGIRAWAKSHNVMFANKQEEEKTKTPEISGVYRSKKTINIEEGDI